MIRRPPRSTQSRSSAASDGYKRQALSSGLATAHDTNDVKKIAQGVAQGYGFGFALPLSLIHISEPTRPY